MTRPARRKARSVAATVWALALATCSTGERPPSDARDAAPPDGPDAELCQRACDATAASPCADRQSCVPRCLESLLAPRCVPETRAFLECGAASGLEAVTCVGGQPLLLPGYCDEENDALLDCVRSAADGG